MDTFLHIFRRFSIVIIMFPILTNSAPYNQLSEISERDVSMDPSTYTPQDKEFCGQTQLLNSLPRNYKFFPEPKTWKKRHLTYKVFNSGNLKMSETRKVVSEAFRLWQAVSTLRFTETHDKNADFRIKFEPTYHDSCHEPFERYVLAHAFDFRFSAVGNIHINEYYQWTIDYQYNYSAIEKRKPLLPVVLHEIGHVLGLDHSYDESSVMFKSLTPFNGDLTKDDILGIQALYGTPDDDNDQTYLHDIDAAVLMRHELFVFKGKNFYRISRKAKISPKTLTSEYWTGLPHLKHFDAVYETFDGTVIFIHGRDFYELSERQTLTRSGQLSHWGLPHTVQQVDSAFTFNDDVYLFVGDQYWRLDQNIGTIDKSIYPRKIHSDFENVPDNVDAAFSDDLGYVYFIKDKRVYIYDMNLNRSVDVYVYPEELRTMIKSWLKRKDLDILS